LGLFGRGGGDCAFLTLALLPLLLGLCSFYYAAFVRFYWDIIFGRAGAGGCCALGLANLLASLLPPTAV